LPLLRCRQKAVPALAAALLAFAGCNDGPTDGGPSSGPALVATLTGAERDTPLIGLNTNAHHSVANWTLAWFRDSTAVLLPALLRYPGGTTANHWDWQTGWFTADATTPPTFANIQPQGTIRAEEFKPGLDATGAEALLVINVQHSTLAYQLDGLEHAASVGIPVRLVELGNEHNLSISNQFMPPDVYADRVRMWADSVRARHPGVKIAAVGGEPPAQRGWHDSIFARSPAIDALAFHIYLGAGNADAIFDAERALGYPFAASGGLLDRYSDSGFETAEVPSDIEVWATEYNLGEVLAGTSKQHAESWTHTLYVSAMSHLLMTVPRVTMLVNHNLTNTLDFAAIDPQTGRITANGVAMILLGRASRGHDRATEVTFPGQPMVSAGGTTYPSLFAWKFATGAQAAAWVVNLSADTLTATFAQALGGAFSYDVYSADPELQVDGVASLSHAAGSSSANVTLPGFSIGVLVR
jgi:hypothetical protein